MEFKVYKNSLTRRATEIAGVDGINEYLIGPNAIAFSNEDVVAPAKIINDFAKKNEALEIKAGIIEGTLHLLKMLKHLQNFHHAKVYFLCFLSVLQAPMRNFALATKAVAEQKEEQGA